MRRASLIGALLLSLLAGISLRADNLYAYRDSVKNGYNFLLYVPDSYYNSEEPLPVILNLHGRSLCGNDLSTITRYGCIDALRRGRKIEAVIICPQCQSTGGWTAERLMNVVDWVTYRFRTDPNRLYVFGISMGGWGTFKFAAAYPDKVAAAIAMCGGYTGEVEPLTQLPLWIIHGTGDRITTINHSTSIVEKMAKTGQTDRVFFSWLSGCDHSILARVFLLQQPYDWLFSHSLQDPDRAAGREVELSPADLRTAYIKLDTSQAQRLPIKKPSR